MQPAGDGCSLHAGAHCGSKTIDWDLGEGSLSALSDRGQGQVQSSSSPPSGLPTFEDAFAAHRAGRVADAAKGYRRLVADAPDHVEALHLLGVAFAQLGAVRPGAQTIRRALRLKPDHADAWNNLANAAAIAGMTGEATASYRSAVALRPDYADALGNLGNLAMTAKDAKGAARWLRSLLAVAPQFPNARLRLGLALKQLRRWRAAAAEFAHALEHNSGDGRLHAELGNMLALEGRLVPAARHGRLAIALVPDAVLSHYAFAITCSLFNDFDASIRVYRRLLAIQPDHAEAHNNLIFALDFAPGADIEGQQRERRRWYDRHGRRWAPAGPVRARDRAPERRLRIGYVSPDFRWHSAALVFGPMIFNFDRSRFDVSLYSNVEIEDDMTARFRAAADRFRSTVGMSDDRMAALIREDEIDILVDLAGHSESNRLLVFARKPAPIQASGWGQGTGTGLDTIDYFLSDPVLVPPEARPFFAERMFDLPCFLGYVPKPDAPPVAPPPVSSGAPLTFGCFNRLDKVTAPAMDVWSRLLIEVPGSRLLLKDGRLTNASDRDRMIATFARRGISADRLVLRGRTSHMEQLATFGEVDVALDPFPHNGGVSTFEALWMGVPVVTRLGNTLPGRNGGAILSALGFRDWVAESDDAYLDIAKRLSGDLAALKRLRTTLRPALAASVVCDPVRYCRAVEDAYREMWRRYCRDVA